MGLTNFLLKRKIKKNEQAGYDYYIRTAKAIETNSVAVGVNRINDKDLSEFNGLLEQTLKGMETLEKMSQSSAAATRPWMPSARRNGLGLIKPQYFQQQLFLPSFYSWSLRILTLVLNRPQCRLGAEE